MEEISDSDRLYFSTYTNLNWLKVLEPVEHKNIIINSLRFLVTDNRIKLYAFVIMPNHIHLVWLIRKEHVLKNVQRDFLKYTAQQIRFNLMNNNDKLLNDLIVNASDRKHQIWERNGHSFLLTNPDIIKQKMNYIHNNPLQDKWKLSSTPSEYFYSSAAFYETEIDIFNILTHIGELL